MNSGEQYLDVLLGVPVAFFPKVSPDGKWVAWTWLERGSAPNVYVAPTDASAAPVKLTDHRDFTWLTSWTADSTALIVVHDNNGDERRQLFRVDLSEPLNSVLLSQQEPSFFLRGGQLHPNNNWLVYGANYDFSTEQELEPTWIYRDDLQTGEKKVLAKPSKAGYVIPDLNRQGTLVLYGRKDLDPSGQQIWLVDIDGDFDREILNFGSKVPIYPEWFPDGKRILFTVELGAYRKVGVYDTGDGSTSWLIDDPTRNIEGTWAPEGTQQIVVAEIKQSRLICSLLDPATRKEEVVHSAAGTLMPLAPAAAGMWIGQLYGSHQPHEIVLFNPASGEVLSNITNLWQKTSLKQEQLIRAQEFSWRSVDNLEIHGWLYRARDPVGTIVIVHGGPTGHDEDSYDGQIQFLVAQGFNIFTPNYRGSTGYGLEFQESIKIDGMGGNDQEDIRTGIEALIKAGIAEPGKIGMTGTSYGGYSSWHAITHFPIDLVAAAAPICGITDWKIDYETTRPDMRTYSEAMMGGSPDQMPERYYERSPINFVGNIKGKLLIVQGMQDPNVTPANVSEVEVALKKAEIVYELLTFEDEGHGIWKPTNQRVLLLRLLDFFQKSLTHSPVAGGQM